MGHYLYFIQHTVRPDRIYLHARRLYQALSLPELPVADVLAIAMKLLTRLLLPGEIECRIAGNV